jgi:hypothetical protein
LTSWSNDPASLLNFKPCIELTKIFIDHFHEICEADSSLIPAAIHKHATEPPVSVAPPHQPEPGAEHSMLPLALRSPSAQLSALSDSHSSPSEKQKEATLTPDPHSSDNIHERKESAHMLERKESAHGVTAQPTAPAEDLPQVLTSHTPSPQTHAQLAAMLSGALATVNMTEPDARTKALVTPPAATTPVITTKPAAVHESVTTSSATHALGVSKALLTPSSTTPLSVTSAASTPSVQTLTAPVPTPQELSPMDTPASFQTPASSLPSSCSSSPPPPSAIRSAHAHLVSSLVLSEHAPPEPKLSSTVQLLPKPVCDHVQEDTNK